MQVLDIKSSHGEFFAIGRGGTHHFRTPAAQDHNHPFTVMRHKPPQISGQDVTLVGQLCTPICWPGSNLLRNWRLVTCWCLAWRVPMPGISRTRTLLMHEPPLKVFIDAGCHGAASQGAGNSILAISAIHADLVCIELYKELGYQESHRATQYGFARVFMRKLLQAQAGY